MASDQAPSKTGTPSRPSLKGSTVRPVSTTQTDLILAREYLRVSQDRGGRMESPGQQHDDNAKEASTRGWALGQSYAEADGVSASRFTRQDRDEFDRLISDLRTGQFRADVLIMWESSRGSRRVGEWATLVDCLEDARVLVHVTTHGRTYDPANARDRRMLLEDAVDSEYESAKISARTRRATAANAREGRPHGRLAYGFRREYAISAAGRRELVGQFPDPVEAPVIRELYARLDLGHSLSAIARDYEQRGIRTRSGKVFVSTHLRDLAMRPVYAGLRVHDPADRHGRHHGPLDGAVPGQWAPLVDLAQFHRVRAMLMDPSRKLTRPGRGIHLLSFIGFCGVCGGQLTVSYRIRNTRCYECRDRACVRIPADDLDQHAEDVFLAYLSQPDVISRLRDRGDDPELDQVSAELSEARADLAGWRTGARDGKVTLESFAMIEPGLLHRIGQLETREAELSVPPALSVIPPGADVAARWAIAPMSARRQVARVLATPPILGTLKVMRAARPGVHVPAAERVEWDCEG